MKILSISFYRYLINKSDFPVNSREYGFVHRLDCGWKKKLNSFQIESFKE